MVSPQTLLYGIYSLIENQTSCTLLVSVTIRHHGIREVSRISYCSKFTDMPATRGLSGDYSLVSVQTRVLLVIVPDFSSCTLSSHD